MTTLVTCTLQGTIGVLTVDAPPVNALSVGVRSGLMQGIARFAADPLVKAIVIACSGRTFIAGADLTEFGKTRAEPTLRAVFDSVENCVKPVIAAIHGSALGGGLELALVCHFRLAVPSAKLGLPEVRLGLLPGAGGTQRLPRLVGVAAALELITSGRSISAREARDTGILDGLTREDRLLEDAVDFARGLPAGAGSLQRVRDRGDKLEAARHTPDIFAQFRASHADRFRGLKAPLNIIEAVEAAVSLPFEEGLARETELFNELLNGAESAALRHVFFAERAANKVPGLSPDSTSRPIHAVGVIGAGTMGSGIAVCFVDAGIPVTLVDREVRALERGVNIVRKNYDGLVKKGRMNSETAEERMSLVSARLDPCALDTVDLVIEAVYESMEVKARVFAEIDRIVKSGAILASNTSFLDLNLIAAATSRPDAVVGLHFFAPAPVMRLLEVVAGRETADWVLTTAMKLAKNIGKVPILSRVGQGFIANRLMRPRGRHAEQMLLEHGSPADIDRVMVDFGFSMGPFETIDLVGLDVLGRDARDRSLRGDLVANGRLGRKSGGGFYDYDLRQKPVPSPVAAQLIDDFSRHRSVVRQGASADDEVVARLLYPVVNEGAKILEEKVAIRASDIDLAAILGYGWPAHTGGPMYWADQVGLPKIVRALRDFEGRYGEEYRPARLLETLAASGKGLMDR